MIRVFFTNDLHMMMNCFHRMVDLRKGLSLTLSKGHGQRFSLSQISDTPQAGFQPSQNLSLDFVE